MHKVLTLVLISVLAACSSATSDSVINRANINVSDQAMVVTANPHASKAGLEILQAGGSAIDAAIAIEAVLSLVEPQSSGLGGGGFMTYFDSKTKQVVVYDGRETAPSLAHENMFLDSSGKPFGFIDAKHSGLGIGVPGMVAMLEMAHSEHGKLEWGAHFDYARKLAVDGFKVSPRLNGSIERFTKRFPQTPEEGPSDAFDYFHDEHGQPLAVGTTLRNLDYADTLRLIAKDPKNFYRGEIANQILEQVSKAPRQGSLSLGDIKNYRAQKRQALCIDYRQSKVCGPQPPSSWVTVGQILGLLEYGPEFSEQGAKDANNWVIFAEAQRLAYADRDRYVADDHFIDVPLVGLLSKDYLQQRAKLIAQDATTPVVPGDPWQYQKPGNNVKRGEDATLDIAGTTHFVVVDKDGNVVSLTASVESIFGSTRIAGGMFLNNQLTDFSFKAKDDNGDLIANRVAANKRPRSSMSPTIMLDSNGDFFMATGSPGGSSIIAYNAKTIVGVLDWGLSPQQAIELPNLVARGGRVRIEKSRADDNIIDGLRRHGYTVKESAGENSGLSMVLKHPDGQLEGGVDPRREGTIETINY